MLNTETYLPGRYFPAGRTPSGKRRTGTGPVGRVGVAKPGRRVQSGLRRRGPESARSAHLLLQCCKSATGCRPDLKLPKFAAPDLIRGPGPVLSLSKGPTRKASTGGLWSPDRRYAPSGETSLGNLRSEPEGSNRQRPTRKIFPVAPGPRIVAPRIAVRGSAAPSGAICRSAPAPTPAGRGSGFRRPR